MRGAGGIGGMAGELAEGRFGVLGDKVIDMPDMADRVARVLHTAGARQPVMATSIPLGDGAPGPAETMRVMRYALACFATGGVGAVRAAGFDHGLPNFLAHAEPRATGVLDALENGRFRLVFQPVVRLSDRAVHHYEALLRPLPIPGQDKCTPQEFVAFAEALGLAEALDLAVLRRTLETIVRTPARVAVNISGMSMQSPSLCNTLFQLLEKHAAAQGRLLIELTETADITDMPAAVATVNRLVAAGVPVCLDDFGAGFAAFRYLKEFPVNFVKIDGAYVRNAQSGARDSGFVGVMVELARGVGAQTIAEMIETEAQAATMRALGVEFGQGWLFGRPGLLPGSLQA
jgi:EAL domain-containing protein (putative c-di-GMP-specific phosphodiesterase class I)